MDDYWAARTGRWRRKMLLQATHSLGERLYEVIRVDIAEGALPAGALLPTAQRVAQELAIDVTDVRAAYARLLADGHIAQRKDGVLVIPGRDLNVEASVGDATQIRFEAALLSAIREAAARGLDSSEATGMFKAAVQRLREIERDRDADRDD
jgi:DNA-binding transcriptional regulator YhcF (GntR family)